MQQTFFKHLLFSFLEIYNEKVRDLLAPLGNTKFALKVREHAKDGPYVPGKFILQKISTFQWYDTVPFGFF